MHVDDDGANRRLMEKLFARYRADDELLSASYGREAIEIARQKHPHLVLLDVNLPDISGEDVLRSLRLESDVPIVMLSGHADEVLRRRMIHLGANGYITKPFDVTTLFELVDSLVGAGLGVARDGT